MPENVILNLRIVTDGGFKVHTNTPMKTFQDVPRWSAFLEGRQINKLDLGGSGVIRTSILAS